ncbi:MAG: hypothetical protein AAF652_13225 [Cyanobacteria bacterium P01_C01_bin.72]
MTQSNGNNGDRLDRIERLLESVTQKTDSNARTIQGILDSRATERLKREEEKAEHQEQMAVMRNAIQQLVRVEQGLANMVANVDENQPTILRKLTVIENKVDSLIERDR